MPVVGATAAGSAKFEDARWMLCIQRRRDGARGGDR